MNKTLQILLIMPLFWLFTGSGGSVAQAQSGELQLNLLLETGQVLEWSQVYQIVIAEQIPAKITLGKLQGENTVVGIFGIEGLDNRLILHGIYKDQTVSLHEWVDNNIRSGSLELTISQNDLTGYWYNQDKTYRLSIHSKQLRLPREIRQYQNGKAVFHTQYSQDEEILISPPQVDPKNWNTRTTKNGRCIHLAVDDGKEEFCRTAHLDLYPYNRVDLVRLLYGLVPQIPHDEVFNRQISDWLDQWAQEIFQEPDIDFEDHRWSHNQSIWFTPDFITEDLVSGLLSIQFIGNQFIHSHSVIYDRNKNQFYTPQDFFRSHTAWGDQFQELARESIYAAHAETIDVFPEVMERIRFHMTLNPQGILISTDYTPYFGRLEVQLKYADYRDDLQRFAPFRKLINQ